MDLAPISPKTHHIRHMDTISRKTHLIGHIYINLPTTHHIGLMVGVKEIVHIIWAHHSSVWSLEPQNT